MVHISYKMSINYCVIKTQIVIILCDILNTTLSYVHSVCILEISKHFQLFKLQTKNGVSGGRWVFIKFICLLIICRIMKSSFIILRGTKSCFYQPSKPAFLLNTSKTCSNIELFSIFSKKLFLELIFASKIKLKQSAVKDILRI